MNKDELKKLEHEAALKAQGFWGEFRTFAVKGNVIDLAVAVVIGTAFNNIVNSLVNDVIMQAIAMIFGKPDFSSIVIGAIKIGSFVNNVVNFFIVAFSVFLAIKFVTKFMPHRNVQEVMPASPEAKAAVKEAAKAVAAKADASK